MEGYDIYTDAGVYAIENNIPFNELLEVGVSVYKKFNTTGNPDTYSDDDNDDSDFWRSL